MKIVENEIQPEIELNDASVLWEARVVENAI
jgi:hypothetical protein